MSAPHRDVLEIRSHDGFEFVEYTAPHGTHLALFEAMVFSDAGTRSKDVSLYRQGHINFIVTRTDSSRSVSRASTGRAPVRWRIRVKDAARASRMPWRRAPRRSRARWVRWSSISGDRGVAEA